MVTKVQKWAAAAATMAALSIAAGTPTAALAEEPVASLSLELNNLTDSATGCLATFMAKNAMQQKLDEVAFEVVLFDTDGRVDRLLVLDFSPLIEGKTRVRQFELPGTQCNGISRVLVNDAAACSGAGVDPHSCIEQLETAARVAVEFGS